MQSLQFEGNQFFSSGDLASTMRIEAIQSSDGQGTLPAYGPDALSVGIELVKDKYIKAGFWDVKITDRISPMQSSDPNRLRLSIGVEEGQRKLLNHLEIEGNRQIQTDEIIDYWQTKVGEPFDHAEILNYQQKVRTEYASRGFFYTTINAELISGTTSLQDAPITLKFTIDEGPRVKFGDIFVAGLVKTNQKVVTREVLFETGDWYDPDLVLASRNALQRLGVFSSVIITPVDPVALANRAEIMDFLIEVKEAPSRTISFGPGWSSFYGMRYNVEGALLNLAGTGRQLFSRASFDQEKSQNAIGPRTLVGRSLSAGYLEPHVLDSEINGKISVSQGARSTAYAWTLTKAGELELTHTLKVILPGSKVGVFYGRDLNEEESRPDAKDAFLADTFSVGRLGVRFNIDHRDDQTWPTKGFTFNSEASWARYELGGDLRYFKWELGNNHYFSLTENLVFALGANFSAYEDIRRRNQSSNDILPATARLGIGGTESVRGFPGEK
ncbi:MAG: BamA/TamA family outer membrane protein, partial [Proteobacteria bacterium]|nr:BamA/TamA family outer membrane protein [Pseudomonadota bacterium]